MSIRSTDPLLSVINNIAHNYTKASNVSEMYRNQLSENFLGGNELRSF